MSRLKTIFSRNRNPINLYAHRFFSTNKSNSASWETMTNDQRINYALQEDEPETSDVAYFKALGLLRLGSEFTDQAVTALQQALDLSGGNYWAATCKLANIYTNLGLEQKALEVWKTGSSRLNDEIKLSDRSVLFDTIKEQLSVDSDSHNIENKITHSLT